MTRIKICGCTSYDDAALALDAGADAVGFIFAPSERRVSVEEAAAAVAQLPPFAPCFAVFVDPEPAEVRRVLSAIHGIRLQFSGSESPELCESLSPGRYLKAFHLEGDDDEETLRQTSRYPRGLQMFDTFDRAARGGTGRPFSWTRLQKQTGPYVVSGGLTPENVGACVRLLRPFAVDVRSGVESDGRKDPNKVRAFVRAVREADAEA